MRRIVKLLPLLVLIAVCLSFLSCEGPKGDTGLVGPQGDEGLNWRDSWSSTASYIVDDAVEYQGSSYVCTRAHTNQAPPNPTYWDLLADEGDPGPIWNGGTVANAATFDNSVTHKGTVDFFSGISVDFTGANVTGLPAQPWNGGTVANLATFAGGADFASGTNVDFTDANVTGLPGGDWNGGTVTNPTTFSPTAPVTFQGQASFENDTQVGSQSGGKNLDVYGEVVIKRSDGTAGARLGVGRSDLILGGNGSNGDLTIYDSAGNPVIATGSGGNLVMNPASGDADLEMYYQGTRIIHLNTNGRSEILGELTVAEDLTVGAPGGNFDLKVWDDANIEDGLTVGGDLDVGGNVNSNVKAFVHPHPTDPSKQIRFITLEGPEHGVYYRGSAQLMDGVAKFSLPEEFCLTAEEEGLNVQITLRGPANGVYVESVSLEGIVVRELASGSSNASFDYFVTGTRRGFMEHQTITENTNFRPSGVIEAKSFGSKFETDNETNRAIRELLIENGTLLQDGSLNIELAVKLGWISEDDARVMLSLR